MDQVTNLISPTLTVPVARPSPQPAAYALNDTFNLPLQTSINQSPQYQSMPAIQSTVLEHIRQGEFVNLNFLLPNNVPSKLTGFVQSGKVREEIGVLSIVRESQGTFFWSGKN